MTTSSTSPSFLEAVTTLGLGYFAAQNNTAPAPAPALPPSQPGAQPGAIAQPGFSMTMPLLVVGAVLVGALLWKKLG
jgi:hypothetical protein